MKKTKKNGFAAIETILIVVVLGILGFAGYFVWHAKQDADKSLTNAAISQPVPNRAPRAPDFGDCITATGSKLELTFPEKCVTKEGKSFTDTETTDKTVIFTTYSRLPDSFKFVYIKHASSEDRMCVNSDGLPINEAGKPYEQLAWYITDKFISVGECNSASIYAMYNGAWTFVDMNQGYSPCKALEKYDVPATLLKRGADNHSNQCLVDESDKLVDYPR
jgi:hypothetical protein